MAPLHQATGLGLGARLQDRADGPLGKGAERRCERVLTVRAQLVEYIRRDDERWLGIQRRQPVVNIVLDSSDRLCPADDADKLIAV